MPHDRQTGPDFLDSLAVANAANGLDINAAEFRSRAYQWRADLQRIGELEAQLAGLERQLRTGADLRRLLAEVRSHLEASNDALAAPVGAANAG